MPDVTFHGGPCALETHSYSDAALADGKVTCKAVVYAVFDNHRGGYFGVPESQIAPAAPVPPIRAASRAWKRLVHGMVRVAPGYLQESARHRRALLRMTRR